jgi:hypothetical protein
MYPSGCLAIIGPFIAALHQASCPVDYECKTCQIKFSKRSAAAKVSLVFICLISAYFIWMIVYHLFFKPEY